MKFVTASNHNYFGCLMVQIAHIKMFFGSLPIVYDLGLTQEQKETLEVLGLLTIASPPCPEEGNGYPEGYRPRALFKPGVLLEICEKHPEEDIVYLDADCRPMKRFEFPTKGIGLVEADYIHGPLWEYVGPYHAGIIFLKSRPDRIDFLTQWHEDLWNDHLPSDTKSLNKVAKNGRITILSKEEYLAEVISPKTKVLHVKGL